MRETHGDAWADPYFLSDETPKAAPSVDTPDFTQRLAKGECGHRSRKHSESVHRRENHRGCTGIHEHTIC